MARFLGLATLALSTICVAQTTVAIEKDGVTTTLLSNIDPLDIAEIPEPELLGPPIGEPVFADGFYDAAAVTKSVLEAVTSGAVDAQTEIFSATATVALPKETEPVVRRSYARGSMANVQKRSSKYPIDTARYDIPSGYTPAFVSYQGATEARGYLTYKTLPQYDPSLCAAACDKIKTCRFFNTYWEKDPDSNGNAVDIVKCSLYGMPQTDATTTNKGQWRGSFRVQITGSNGYNKATPPVSPDGYSLRELPAAVNAPLWDSSNQWRFIQPVYLDKYDTGLCAAACDKQTQYNKAHASNDCGYKTCAYANLYILSQDGVPKTVVCALYTEGVNETYATNKGYSTDDASYQVSNSVGLTNKYAVAAGYPIKCAPLSSSTSQSTSSQTTSSSSILPSSTTTTSTTATSTTTTSSTTISTTITSSTTSSSTNSSSTTSQIATSSTSSSTSSSSTTSQTTTSSAPSSSGTTTSKYTTTSSTTSEPVSSSTTSPATTTSLTTSVEYSSSTTASTTTTSSASSSPTTIVGNLQGADANYDDNNFAVDLPFPIGVFGKTSTRVYVTVNGAIALEPFQTDGFYPWDLVVVDGQPPLHLSTYIPDHVAAGFYYDLSITAGAQQGIFYDVEGTTGSRSVVFDFYETAQGRPTEVYHFSITFYEDKPGVFDTKIHAAKNEGDSVYVGSQDKSVSPVKEIAVSTGDLFLLPGTLITIDTIAGTSSQSTFQV